MMPIKVCYTYIVRCIDGTLYTGITYDLEKRLKQHNGATRGGAKYTRDRRPVTLVYSEEYTSYHDAAHREHEIKQLTRQEKLRLMHDKIA